MIIPDYNKGTVNVHMRLSEKDVALPDEAIAAKAFMCMTGLKPVSKITETSWQDVQYQVFETQNLRMYVACGRVDTTDDYTINASVLVRDRSSYDVIVSFNSVGIGRVTSENDIVPIIDFLSKYRHELFVKGNDVIV